MRYFKRLQRFLAGVIVVTFFATNTFTPAPMAYARGVESAPFLSGFTIPAECGKVTGIIPASRPSPGPVLIHIQEAHANYDAQTNIKKILEHLSQNYGVKLILLEGAGNKLMPEIFRFFPEDPKPQQQANEKLIQAGELTGAEVFLIDSYGVRRTNDSVLAEGWGVENAEAYREGREAYRAVYNGRELTASFLEAFYRQWQKVADRKLNKPLKEFLSRNNEFDEERLPLSEWMSFLKTAAARDLKIDLDDVREQLDWPVLVRYFRLKHNGSQIDITKARKEQEAFLSDLRARKIHEPLLKEITSLLEQRNTSDLPVYKTRFAFERLMDVLPADYSFEPYPVFRLHLQQLILLSEIQSEALQSEIHRLSAKILESLIKISPEKKLVDMLQSYVLLRKLLRLELNRKELEDLKASAATPEKMASDLGLKTSRLAPVTGLFETALRFYDTAIQREEMMMQNTLRRMQENQQTKAVLITGGFHTDGLKTAIEASGVSYIGITPNIGQVTKEEGKNYIQALLGSERRAESAERSDNPNAPRSTLRAEVSNQSPLVRSDLRFIQEVSTNPRAELRAIAERIAGIAPEAAETVRRHFSSGTSVVRAEARTEISAVSEGPASVPGSFASAFNSLQRLIDAAGRETPLEQIELFLDGRAIQNFKGPITAASWRVLQAPIAQAMRQLGENVDFTSVVESVPAGLEARIYASTLVVTAGKTASAAARAGEQATQNPRSESRSDKELEQVLVPAVRELLDVLHASGEKITRENFKEVREKIRALEQQFTRFLPLTGHSWEFRILHAIVEHVDMMSEILEEYLAGQENQIAVDFDPIFQLLEEEIARRPGAEGVALDHTLTKLLVGELGLAARMTNLTREDAETPVLSTFHENDFRTGFIRNLIKGGIDLTRSRIVLFFSPLFFQQVRAELVAWKPVIEGAALAPEIAVDNILFQVLARLTTKDGLGSMRGEGTTLYIETPVEATPKQVLKNLEFRVRPVDPHTTRITRRQVVRNIAGILFAPLRSEIRAKRTWEEEFPWSQAIAYKRLNAFSRDLEAEYSLPSIRSEIRENAEEMTIDLTQYAFEESSKITLAEVLERILLGEKKVSKEKLGEFGVVKIELSDSAEIPEEHRGLKYRFKVVPLEELDATLKRNFGFNDGALFFRVGVVRDETLVPVSVPSFDTPSSVVTGQRVVHGKKRVLTIHKRTAAPERIMTRPVAPSKLETPKAPSRAWIWITLAVTGFVIGGIVFAVTKPWEKKKAFAPTPLVTTGGATRSEVREKDAVVKLQAGDHRIEAETQAVLTEGLKRWQKAGLLPPPEKLQIDAIDAYPDLRGEVGPDQFLVVRHYDGRDSEAEILFWNDQESLVRWLVRVIREKAAEAKKTAEVPRATKAVFEASVGNKMMIRIFPVEGRQREVALTKDPFILEAGGRSFFVRIYIGTGEIDKSDNPFGAGRTSGILTQTLSKDVLFTSTMTVAQKWQTEQAAKGRSESRGFLEAFVPMFVAVNALGVLPFVISIMNGAMPRERIKVIRNSLVTAGFVAGVFLFAGDGLLNVLGIDNPTFRIAGGIVLFLISVKNILGAKDVRVDAAEEMGSVPIGVPFIVGPAVITTILALKARYGTWATLSVTLLNILIAGAVFHFGASIERFLGKNGIRTLSKVASLLLASMGVAMVLKGLKEEFPRDGGTPPPAVILENVSAAEARAERKARSEIRSEKRDQASAEGLWSDTVSLVSQYLVDLPSEDTAGEYRTLRRSGKDVIRAGEYVYNTPVLRALGDFMLKAYREACAREGFRVSGKAYGKREMELIHLVLRGEKDFSREGMVAEWRTWLRKVRPSFWRSPGFKLLAGVALAMGYVFSVGAFLHFQNIKAEKRALLEEAERKDQKTQSLREAFQVYWRESYEIRALVEDYLDEHPELREQMTTEEFLKTLTLPVIQDILRPMVFPQTNAPAPGAVPAPKPAQPEKPVERPMPEKEPVPGGSIEQDILETAVAASTKTFSVRSEVRKPGVAVWPFKSIMHIAWEMAPFKKAGGLADVIGELPLAMKRKYPDMEVSVTIPYHKDLDLQGVTPVFFSQFGYDSPDGYQSWEAFKVEHQEMSVFLLQRLSMGAEKDAPLFIRGYKTDNFYEGANFSKAAVEFMAQSGIRPDILHPHDQMAAYVPAMIRDTRDEFFRESAVVYTAHHFAPGYQGREDLERGRRYLMGLGLSAGLFGVGGALNLGGQLNPLKGASSLSDFLSTVSGRFAWEAANSSLSEGLQDLLLHRFSRSGTFVGVTNAIDKQMWSPETGAGIQHPFTQATITGGKQANKSFLQMSYGLKQDPAAPLLVFISRYDAHVKGFDIVPQVVGELMSYFRDLQVVFAGDGDAGVKENLRKLKEYYPDRVYVSPGFVKADTVRSILAAADFVGMPSRIEPAGLVQQQGHMLGAIPIVTRVGGLEETVHDPIFVQDTGAQTGFKSNLTDQLAITFAMSVVRALGVYYRDRDRGTQELLRIRLDGRDSVSSWDDRVDEYFSLYQKALQNRKQFITNRSEARETDATSDAFAKISPSPEARVFLRAWDLDDKQKALVRWLQADPQILERVRLSRGKFSRLPGHIGFYIRKGEKRILRLNLPDSVVNFREESGDDKVDMYRVLPEQAESIRKSGLGKEDFWGLPLQSYYDPERATTLGALLEQHGIEEISPIGFSKAVETRFYYHQDSDSIQSVTAPAFRQEVPSEIFYDAEGRWLSTNTVKSQTGETIRSALGGKLLFVVRNYEEETKDLSSTDAGLLATERVPLIVIAPSGSFKVWTQQGQEVAAPSEGTKTSPRISTQRKGWSLAGLVAAMTMAGGLWTSAQSGFGRVASLWDRSQVAGQGRTLPSKTFTDMPDKNANARSEVRSWAAENAPELEEYTVISRQLEAGLSRDILEKLKAQFGEKIAGLVAATTVTGGLGALMHDLFPSWQKNFGQPKEERIDAFAVNVIYDEIKGQAYAKDLPEEVTSGKKTLGDYLREVLTEDPELRLTVSLNAGDEFRGKADEWIGRTGDGLYRKRLQQAREAVDREIKVKVYPTETSVGGMPNFYIEAFYINDDGKKIQIFDEVYPDAPHGAPNLWRDLQMGVYRKVTELLTSKLQEQGVVKKKILFVDNEVFVSLPTPLLPEALHHHMNHSVFAPTIYQPDEASLEVLGYPRALKPYIVRNGKISITDAAGMTFDLITGVALYEHTPAVTGGVMPGYADVVDSYNEDGLRSTNGVLLEQWQSPLLKGLIDTYKKKLGMNVTADDRMFFAKLSESVQGSFLNEFKERTEVIKAFLTGRLMLWLKESQNRPGWFDQAMKAYKEEFGLAEVYGDRLLADLNYRIQKALADEKEWAALLADAKIQALKREFLKKAIVSNVRRQVSYKGPDKWIEVLRALKADPAKLEWYKKNAARAVIGGREFGSDAHGLFLEIQHLVRELGLEDQFATIENYNIEVAPIIFQGISGSVMLSYEILEASATSMMKGLPNGAALIGVWGGAEPELFTIIESATGREVNIFKEHVTYGELIEKLHAGDWKITNGFLVEYSASGDGKFVLNTIVDGKIQTVNARPPSADSLTSALAQLQDRYQAVSGRRELLWQALRSSPVVDMEKSQARAHMKLWQRTIVKSEKKKVLLEKPGLSPESALKFLSQRAGGDAGFIWRNETSNTVEIAPPGPLAFIESVRQLRTHAAEGYRSVAYHAAKGDIFARIFHYLSGYENEAPALYQEMSRLKAQADEATDLLEKVKANLAALRLLDRFVVALSGNVLQGYINSRSREYEVLFKNDLFRQNLYFYLETNGRRFGSMNKSLAGFAIQEGEEKFIIALNLGEPKYPGIDGGEPKAWGQFYGQREFEWLTGQADPESATMTYQVINAITGEAYGTGENRKPYPFWMLAQGTLPVGVPSPDIQILKLRATGEMKPEEKQEQLASLILDDLRALVSGDPREQLRQGKPRVYWLKKMVAYYQHGNPGELKTHLKAVSGIGKDKKDKRESAIALFGAEGVRPVMAFIAVLVPELLEDMKDWDAEVYAALKSVTQDPEVKDLFERGEVSFSDASSGTAIVISRTLQEETEGLEQKRHVVIPIHFAKTPYNKEEGKVWFGIGSIAKLGLLPGMVYQSRDILLGQLYEKKHTLASLLKEGWRVGIPVVKRKDPAGIQQTGWRFQVLQMVPVEVNRSESREGSVGTLIPGARSETGEMTRAAVATVVAGVLKAKMEKLRSQGVSSETAWKETVPFATLSFWEAHLPKEASVTALALYGEAYNATFKAGGKPSDRAALPALERMLARIASFAQPQHTRSETRSTSSGQARAEIQDETISFAASKFRIQKAVLVLKRGTIDTNGNNALIELAKKDPALATFFIGELTQLRSKSENAIVSQEALRISRELRKARPLETVAEDYLQREDSERAESLSETSLLLEEVVWLNVKAGGGTEQGFRGVTENITDGIWSLYAHKMNALEAVVSLLPASYAKEKSGQLQEKRIAKALKMAGFTDLRGSDVFILDAALALDEGGIGMMDKVFTGKPFAVLARNEKDVEFLRDLNVKRQAVGLSPIETAATISEAQDILYDALLSRPGQKTVTYKAMALATDIYAVALKKQFGDDAVVFELNRFKTFLSVAGVSALVSAMQAEYLATSRSA